MFLLINIVLAKNICVEATPGRCNKVCSSFHLIFDKNYSNIPEDSLIEGLFGNEIHNIYIADNVYYRSTKNNIILCDPTNYLVFDQQVTSLNITDDIIVNSVIIKPNISLLLQFNSNFVFNIDVINDTQNFSTILLEALNDDIVVNPVFLTENLPRKMFKMSNNSKEIKVYDKTEYLLTVFENDDKIIEIPKKYYCISDKENKCQKYSSYNLTFIDKIDEIEYLPNIVLIIDTSTSLIYKKSDNSYPFLMYTHFIAMPGTDFIYYYDCYDLADVILHKNYIEMKNAKFEGEGNFTYVMNEIRLYSTSNINNFNFTLKSKYPLNYYSSQIIAYKPNFEIDLVNKIKVPEYCILHGDKSLQKLFEPRKFICQENLFLNNITAEQLTEYDYYNLNYYFSNGEQNIPKTWKKKATFNGNKNTTFIFNDVYIFSNNEIDNFINVQSYNRIILKPACFLFLRRFERYSDDTFTIIVDHDFIIDGWHYNDHYVDRDEITPDKSKCKIIGNGTIKFTNLYFMDDIKYFCDIDENVKLVKLNTSYPRYNACIGQSDLEKCKAEIKDIDSSNDFDWIWLRNIADYNIPSAKKYVTDEQFIEYYYSTENTKLTSNAKIVYLVAEYQRIRIQQDTFEYFQAETSSAKVIVLYSGTYSYDGKKKEFNFDYIEPPTKIDLDIHFYYENIKLISCYTENFTQNSVKLNGKCTFFIREPYIPMLKLFDNSENIKFAINPDYDYRQLCFAENALNCGGLDDFVLAKNYDEFIEYEYLGNYCSIYLRKDINLKMDNYSFAHSVFGCSSINLSIDLPNNPTILFYDNKIEVIVDKVYCFNVVYNTFPIFNVKEKINFINNWNYIGDKYCKINSTFSTVEIVANHFMSLFYHIFISNNITIISPVPQYINHLFDSDITVIQSPKWSYLYTNVSSKKLFNNYTAFPLDEYQCDDNLLENIVLAVGPYEKVSIPSNWKYHNIYILQENIYNYNYWNGKPKSLTYLVDGVIIDNKTKIIGGEIDINLPRSFVLNAEFNINFHIYKLMYSANLYCGYDPHNSDTYLYPGSLNISDYFTTLDHIKTHGIYSYNMLVVKAKSADDVQNIIYLLNVDKKYVKFSFLYDYICYYAANDLKTKCPGNRFEASDSTSLLMAIKDNPNTPISVGQDLTIPYQSQNHFILNIKEDNITINLPLTPLSMLIQDESHIQVNYDDDTLIDIYNDSILYIPIMDTFEFNYESETNSIIYLKLNSDVLFSTKSNLSANFNISVINNNGYKLYAEDVGKFENIFDFPLIQYVRVCAYDINASSLCTYKTKDLLENVFNKSFNYNEVEITLLSNRNIELPNISSFINVNIISNSSSVLNVNAVTDLELTSNIITINNYWKFFGDKEVLNINLNKSLSLSITDYITTPISFQLLDGQTEINLKRCIYPYGPIITIHHNGSYQNKITVYGSTENYNNFIHHIINHDGITFNHDGVQKYLCLCNDENSCDKCEENIDGYIEKASTITADPGDNVEIRVFSNIEISSSLFQSQNNVYVDPKCHLNLTNAETVDQNFYYGLKVDNLYFTNVNNLLIKPKGPQLNINMKTINYGLHFSIEIESFLRLNVINSYDRRINASRLYVSGSGELNLYDYPYNRIRANSTVKVIKGVYTICNARAGNNICTYVTDEGYKTLNNYDGFSNDFDPDSKIIVFVNSFSNNLDADINYLKGQKVSFINKKTSLSNKLDDEKQVKVRFYPTTELTRNSDLTTELTNSNNGALLDITDSDLFIVGFNESLTIKQNGDISSTKSNPIVLQPMNEKVTIIVDDSVDIENQKMIIEPENNEPVSVTIKSNKKNSDELNNLFQTDPEKVSIIVEQNSSSKKLPKAAIIGIVVGAIVIIAVLIILIIVLVKKKAKSLELSDSESTVDSGSIRI